MSTTTLHLGIFLHAANLRHWTDGFTFPPKEGVLRIFSPLKIRRLRPTLNPRTWVLKASTLTPQPPKPLTCRVNYTPYISDQVHSVADTRDARRRAGCETEQLCCLYAGLIPVLSPPCTNKHIPTMGCL